MAEHNLSKYCKQAIFIDALTQLGTIEAACEEAKISRRTYYNWLKDDKFLEKIQDKQYFIDNKSLDTLTQLFEFAMGSYLDLVFSNNESIRLRTATAIIKNTSNIIKFKKFGDEYQNWVDVRYEKPFKVIPNEETLPDEEEVKESKCMNDKL